MLDIFGDRPLAAARELTKRHEEIIRSTLSGAVVHFQEKEPRGEFTLVVGVAGREEEREAKGSGIISPSWYVSFLEAGGLSRQEAIRETAKRLGIPRREVYSEVVRDKARNKERETF